MTTAATAVKSVATKITPPATSAESGFATLGVSYRLLDALTKMKITIPTPIQQQSIPVGLEGKDILGIAQTGTGKTLAFGLPILHRLDHCPGRALILLPTRELAVQVNDMLQPLGKIFGIKTAVLIGGVSLGGQIRDLAQHPRIIIATPGRLLDLMEQRKCNLGDVSIFVLDEADRMFDMGFAPQLNRIVKVVPKQRQTMMFSATMPKTVLNLATAIMPLPVQIEVAPAGTTINEIEQEIYVIRRESKMALLEKLLQSIAGTVLVFGRTKQNVKRMTQALKLMGHKVTEIHSNRTQSQRSEALAGFKSNRYRVLIATDIAARGIDVQGIEAVINFDLPSNSEDYVHRIGRTGRAGKKGRAISFATPDQRAEIRAIEQLIRKPLPVVDVPGMSVKEVPKEKRFFDPRDRRANPSKSPQRRLRPF